MAGIEQTFHELINPSNSEYLDDSLPEFLAQIQLNDDAIMKTVALIGHKLQSPLELEALTACHIVEFLVREGGASIHKHVSMFKFLNDCIRVLSPKYLGKRTTPKVKSRVTELLFCWAEAMPHYVKLRDAYAMLKRNNIIKMDPQYNDRIMIRSVAKVERPSYLDENRELLLKELLRSKNAEDHKKANKLIQLMIREDDEKVEKKAKRLETVDEAGSVSERLIELTQGLAPGCKGVGLSSSDRDEVDSLYQQCSRLRPTIFRMASEVTSDTEVSEVELTTILQVNDQLQKAISLFDINIGQIQAHPSSGGGGGEGPNLLDLGDGSPLASQAISTPKDDVLTNSLKDLGLESLIDMPSSSSSTTVPSQSTTTQDLLSGVLNGNASSHPPSAAIATQAKQYTIEELSLDAQKAASIYDSEGIRCIAYPCQNRVCLFTLMNTSNAPIAGFQLQIAVTKQVQVSIQDPDRTELAAFNPIITGPTINQIVSFVTQLNDIKVKFRLIFTHNGAAKEHIGECALKLI